MKASKTKYSIYLRTFACLLCIWLILMSGFSAYILNNARKAAATTFGQDINSMNSALNSTPFDNTGEYELPQAVNLVGFSKRSTKNYNFAIYSKDYDLIYSPENTWVCTYGIPIGGNSWKIKYGFIYPEKWFTDSQIDELKFYLTHKGDSKKIGAFCEYSTWFNGWENGSEFIPDKIWAVGMYIQSVDSQGNVTGSTGSVPLDGTPKFASGYENRNGLTYYNNGQIQVNSVVQPQNITKHLGSEDKEKLEKAAASFGKDIVANTMLKTEKTGLFSERYYMALPYDKNMKMNYSATEYWIAVSGECSYLTGIMSTLLIVWLMCLGVFLGTAWILASQTWKTYRRQAEMEKQRKDTTNAIAHDLKTPLAAISGYAENLINDIHTEKREHYAARIQYNAQRMDQIVQEMLSLSRLESGSHKSDPEELSLKEITDEAVAGNEDCFAENNISCSVLGDAVITADRTLILRAINNFLSNASTYTNQNGKIAISITNSRWIIENTGNQIPEDQLKAVWQAYYKTDEARSNPKGSGLGLSIVKSIMELHSFKYGGENTEKGVKFWFEY